MLPGYSLFAFGRIGRLLETFCVSCSKSSMLRPHNFGVEEAGRSRGVASMHRGGKMASRVASRAASRLFSSVGAQRASAAHRAANSLAGGALPPRSSAPASVMRRYSAAWDGGSIGDHPQENPPHATSAPENYVQRPTKGDVGDQDGQAELKSASPVAAHAGTPRPNLRVTRTPMLLSVAHALILHPVRRHHDR